MLHLLNKTTMYLLNKRWIPTLLLFLIVGTFSVSDLLEDIHLYGRSYLDSRELLFYIGFPLLYALTVYLLLYSWQKGLMDRLTELYNSRHLHRNLKAILEARKRLEVSVLLIDVDSFKNYNDQHGHLEGDYALMKLAGVIKKSIRGEQDIPCRYGGDEFAVILPQASPEDAYKVAERIRQNVASKLDIPITVSIGIATSWKGATAADLIKQADDLMYRAKEKGKNRVALSTAAGVQIEG